MNLYGAPGMGAAGTGWGTMPQVPGNGMSPQLMQLIQSLQQGGGAGAGGAIAPAPGPLQAPATGTPMANFIGTGGMPGAGMQHPMPSMPAVAPSLPAGATTGSPNSQPMGAFNPQMLAMLQALKGQQTGVTPGGGTTPAGAFPQMAPGLNLPNGQAAAPGMDQLLRSLGYFGGRTGGAPT